MGGWVGGVQLRKRGFTAPVLVFTSPPQPQSQPQPQPPPHSLAETRRFFEEGVPGDGTTQVLEEPADARGLLEVG